MQRDGGVGMVDCQVRNVVIMRLRSGCDFNDSALPCGDPGVSFYYRGCGNCRVVAIWWFLNGIGYAHFYFFLVRSRGTFVVQGWAGLG